MCMWDNMVECTKGIMLCVFNIWVGLWSNESVCSVCYVVFRECARATQGWIWRLQSYVWSVYLEAAGCELWWLDVYMELY